MKTVFIINPKAGQGKNIEPLISSIKECVLSNEFDAAIYITKSVGDARRFVNEYCAEYGPARFIACGGDGTLNEVLNGAVECSGAQVGVLPIGTGNDFCRNFDKSADFSDIVSQVTSETEKCDAIRYTTTVDGVKKVGYCVNMINIGFDCNVADMTTEMKKKPLISGPLAYFVSILVAMVEKKGADLLIKMDEEEVYNGKLLLTSIANGSFCGGGIKSNPLASVSDGVMNVNIIKNIKRVDFIPLLPRYMNGTVLELKNIDKYLINRDCQKIEVIANNEKMRICIDGEIIDAGNTTFEVVHNAFDFVVPYVTSKQVVNK